ncbi:Flp pilus assembly complex ATPase component TadA [Neptunicella marina]|uniref:Flp pilus assembly complex ATPase component TadA n=2 Tax=Neptunicella marina TaxID=2125989 RepID=A0A8J6IUP2_9ALTE|nr:Flp pilus assembly complex ATPase component TadA [Neptunicella marina]
MMQPKLKMRLGDLLVHEGVINEAQLQQALTNQKSSGRKLGKALMDLGFVTEQHLHTFLAQQLKVPLLDIAEIRLDPVTVKLIPEMQARRYRALAIEEHADYILIGMSDPADLTALDALGNILSKPIQVAVVMESQLLDAYETVYRRTEEIASFAQELASEYQDEQEFDFMSGVSGEEDTAVARLLQSIFEEAVQMKASDIHIEPDEGMLRIRQRIDGILQENVIKEHNIANALVLRLKLMSRLDISERRMPQDGRTHISVKGHRIDVRISTMPVQHGESVVMRLLDQSAGLLTLEQAGMPAAMVRRFSLMLGRPHGMILVTGPTGSGKTTTLYSALARLNQPGVKIITVEDPVEYRLPRISQVQVNSQIGLDFSSVLRTTLRQDPDIIMVGEMRDTETVEIGLRGALTGHLVLSTLHTNDAISSAIRLIDMGAPGYLVASSLRAIVAQRLIRKICVDCKQDYQPSADEVFWLNNVKAGAGHLAYKHGRGCQKCHHTGYSGRVGVFELLEMTESMMNALKNSDTVAFSQAAKESPGYASLAEAALEYAKQGVTSVDEILRLVEMVTDDRNDREADHAEIGSQDNQPARLTEAVQPETPKPQAPHSDSNKWELE